MDICKYCKDKKMNKEEYKTFKSNIVATAQAIRSTLVYNGGMYYQTHELFKYNSNEDIKHFIIQELKNLGIEFFKDNTLYRVTE